jgi:hypothetical protein
VITLGKPAHRRGQRAQRPGNRVHRAQRRGQHQQDGDSESHRTPDQPCPQSLLTARGEALDVVVQPPQGGGRGSEEVDAEPVRPGKQDPRGGGARREAHDLGREGEPVGARSRLCLDHTAQPRCCITPQLSQIAVEACPGPAERQEVAPLARDAVEQDSEFRCAVSAFEGALLLLQHRVPARDLLRPGVLAADCHIVEHCGGADEDGEHAERDEQLRENRTVASHRARPARQYAAVATHGPGRPDRPSTMNLGISSPAPDW